MREIDLTQSLLPEIAEALQLPLNEDGIEVVRAKYRNAEVATIELPVDGRAWLIMDASLKAKGNPFVDFLVSSGDEIIGRKRISPFSQSWTLELPKATGQLKSVTLMVSSLWIEFTLNSVQIVDVPPPGGDESAGQGRHLSTLEGINARFDPLNLDMIEVSELDDRAGLIAAAGLNIDALKSYFSKSFSHGEDPDWAAREPVIELSYKEGLLRDPHGMGRSLSDGSKSIQAQMAVPLFERVVTSFAYEYCDEFPWVVFTDQSFAGSVGCILIPDRDILVFDKNYWSTSWRSSKEVIDQYLGILQARGDEISSMRGKLDTPLVVTKTCKNMGHFFYNELCGVLSARDRMKPGQTQLVAELHDNWISCEDIFSDDELAIEKIKGPDLLDQVLERGLFPVRATTSRVHEPHARQIGDKAYRALQRDEPERAAQVARLTKTRNVLFVNLRSHNKSWDRQVTGLARFIIEYQARVGEPVAAYFDGFHDCADVMASIVDLLPDDITCIDGLNVSMYETLVWSYKCDFFIAVIGSGLVPLTWLGDRPGICYAEAQHMKQLSFWPLVRDAASPLYYPDEKTITQDRNAMYSNFDFPDSELDRLLDIHFGQTNSVIAGSHKS